MGSQAQDSRHDRMMQDYKENVFSLERQVEAKQFELKKLEEDLVSARKDLIIQEAIDMKRD